MHEITIFSKTFDFSETYPGGELLSVWLRPSEYLGPISVTQMRVNAHR
jgi:hypothetical protein